MDNTEPNQVQVGGNHYQSFVQHWDFVANNSIPYHEGNATRYLSRWRKKNGVQDLEKALHYVDKIISLFDEGVRLPARAGRDESFKNEVYRFAYAYGMTRPEAHCCYLICGWRGVEDLLTAKQIISEIIHNQLSARGE